MANALAGFCAVLVLGALTVVISRGALPGDTLYGVKRASESTELGLTSGPEARGRKNLDFAATRLDEISGLIQRDSATAAGRGPAAGGLDPATATLVAGNLQAFDQQARAASKLLLPLIGHDDGPARGELADWARSQSTRLGSLGPSLPTSAQSSAADSRRLMDRLGDRASALDERSSCPDAASSGEDDFGPVPLVCGNNDRTVAVPSAAPATSTTEKKTTTRTTTEDPTSSEGSSSRTSSDSSTSTAQRSSRTATTTTTTKAPAPVNVPLPVPGLPPVSVPPLVPGIPGISLGG